MISAKLRLEFDTPDLLHTLCYTILTAVGQGGKMRIMCKLAHLEGAAFLSNKKKGSTVKDKPGKNESYISASYFIISLPTAAEEDE